jgi:hypothetical protein
VGFLIKVRLKKINQDPILPDHNFNRDHDRDEKFSIKVWLKIKNQSLLKIFQSGFDDQKSNTCTLLHKFSSRRKIALVHHFSIKGCSKIFNQGLVDPDQIFNQGHDRD